MTEEEWGQVNNHSKFLVIQKILEDTKGDDNILTTKELRKIKTLVSNIVGKYFSEQLENHFSK